MSLVNVYKRLSYINLPCNLSEKSLILNNEERTGSFWRFSIEFLTLALIIKTLLSSICWLITLGILVLPYLKSFKLLKNKNLKIKILSNQITNWKSLNLYPFYFVWFHFFTIFLILL